MAPEELTLVMAHARQAGEDTAGFEALLERHQRLVLGLALRLLGDMEDAKDAAQEVLFRLHKYRGSLRSGEAVEPWLYRVTVNVCRDLRRKQRELPLEETLDPPDGSPGADFGIEMTARRELVRRALLMLPDRQREVVVLHDIEGLSTREVAAAQGSAEATVRSQLCTGRARLRDLCAAMLRKKS
jgi:RNA polymerase sigma-70 factor (ECF subfamily)